MVLKNRQDAFSYIESIEFSGWDGRRPLIVFDGICLLCSHFARWVVRHDVSENFCFSTAQSDLGQALYAHFDLDGEEFETNLVIIDGRLYEKLDAMIAVCRVLGWPWRLVSVMSLLPQGVKDWLYNRIARNRYRLFGKREMCLVPDGKLAERMVE